MILKTSFIPDTIQTPLHCFTKVLFKISCNFTPSVVIAKLLMCCAVSVSWEKIKSFVGILPRKKSTSLCSLACSSRSQTQGPLGPTSPLGPGGPAGPLLPGGPARVAADCDWRIGTDKQTSWTPSVLMQGKDNAHRYKLNNKSSIFIKETLFSKTCLRIEVFTTEIKIFYICNSLPNNKSHLS